jgi:hypothetical protein
MSICNRRSVIEILVLMFYIYIYIYIYIERERERERERTYKAETKRVYTSLYILNTDGPPFFIELGVFTGVVIRTDFMLAAPSVIH